MTNNPARIWATVNGASTDALTGQRSLLGGWNERPDKPHAIEYVRADLVEALDTEAIIDLAHDIEGCISGYLADDLEQSDLAEMRDLIRRALVAINGGQDDE